MNIEQAFKKYVAQRNWVKLCIISKYLVKLFDVYNKGYYLLHLDTAIKIDKAFLNLFAKHMDININDIIVKKNKRLHRYYLTIKMRAFDLTKEKKILSSLLN